MKRETKHQHRHVDLVVRMWRGELIFPFVAFLLVLVCLAIFPWQAIMFPDSPSYLSYSPSRDPGYPLFLRLSLSILGDVNAVPALQLAIAGVASSYLAVEVRRTFGSPIIALGLLLALWVLPPLLEIHRSILSDSLFLSLSMVALAALLATVRTRTVFWLIVLSLVIGLMVAVRSAGWSFAFLPVLTAFLYHGVWRLPSWRMAAAAVLPFVLTVVVSGLTHRVIHGEKATSQAYLMLFSRGAMAAKSERGSLPENIASVFSNDLNSIQKIIDETPDSTTQLMFLTRYTVFFQYQYLGLRPQVRKALASGDAQAPGSIEAGMKRFGTNLLLSNPGTYLEQTARNYFGLWWLYEVLTAPEAKAFNKYVEANWPLPLIGEATFRRVRTPFWYAVPLKALMGLVFLSSLWPIVIAIWVLIRKTRMHPPHIAAFLASLALHGNFVFVAATNIAHARYSLDLWPVMIVLLAVAAHDILRFLSHAWRRMRWEGSH